MAAISPWTRQTQRFLPEQSYNSAIQNTLSAWLPGDDRRHKRATANGDDDRLGVLHHASPFRVDAQDDRDKATPAQTPEGLKAGRHYM